MNITRLYAASVFTLLAVTMSPAALAQASYVTLATNPAGTVNTLDYEASIQRIPEKDRFGWAMSQERVSKEVEGLMRFRTLAAESRRLGLDKDPLFQARLKIYEERLLTEALFARTDAEANKDFDARLAVFTERAREQYLINKKNYQQPAQVKAAHILVKISSRSVDEALAKTQALRARLVAGASFEELAQTESDDPTAKQNKGELGWFQPGQMDPAFEKAAFALSKPNELSEPVRSQFGFHIIRFEDKKPARELTFEEAKPDLLEKARAANLETRRTQIMQSLYDPAKIQWNEPAVLGLRKTVDPAIYKALEK